MSEVPDLEMVDQIRVVNARLRELLAAKDDENARLRTLVAAQGLRIEALERQLASGSDDSGTPTSKESLVARARRKAERKARRQEAKGDKAEGDKAEGDKAEGDKAEGGGGNESGARRERDRDLSSRERSPERQRGGQPGHPGHGLQRDPNPQCRQWLEAPEICCGCGGGLSDADGAGTAWSQVWECATWRWSSEWGWKTAITVSS